MHLTLSYPAWYILLCILLGAAGAFLLYYRDRRFADAGPAYQKIKWLLAVFRFLSLTFLAVLLLSPLLRTVSNKIEKPVILIAQDHSQSVAFKERKSDSLQYIQNLNSLAAGLSKNFDVRPYSFGSSVKEGLDFSFTDKATNISDALDQLQNDYSNQNVGALILATDGLYNEGSNPQYANWPVNIPIYTIGLGDTSMQHDAFIETVKYNHTVYLNDYFSIAADWRMAGFPHQHSTITLSQIDNGSEKSIDQKDVQSNGDDASGEVSFLLRANSAGILHYQITLNPLPGEENISNNTRDIFVEVQEKKEKILIVANSPHPDVAALKQSIEVNKNYQADIALNNFNSDLSDYSLIILHELPSTTNNAASLLQNIQSKKKSVLFILGAQSNLSAVSNAQSLLRIDRANGTTGDVYAQLNNSFSLFNVPAEFANIVPQLPPLESPFGNYTLNATASSFMQQRIGKLTTAYPLIALGENENGRVGVICGEGLWRWRLYDFMQNNNEAAFDALTSALLQYLTVTADNRPFRVELAKESEQGGTRVYGENEGVTLNAFLFNESHQLINNPDVSVEMKNDSGRIFPYQFGRTNDAYTLNAGYFPAGNYSFTAKTTYNQKTLSASGTFLVTPTQIELTSTKADHQLLYALSEKTGGQLFYPNQMDALTKAIENRKEIKPVLYSSSHTDPLINLRWLLAPLILLLALEWGLRKYFGGY